MLWIPWIGFLHSRRTKKFKGAGEPIKHNKNIVNSFHTELECTSTVARKRLKVSRMGK